MSVLQKIILVVITTLCCISCTPKNAHQQADETADSRKPALTRGTLFILGKDFYTQKDIFRYIYALYAEESRQSHIHLLPYSDVTAKTQEMRTKILTDYLDDHPDITTIISIGLPEGYARSLIAVKEKNPFLLIITLLPIENHLLLEACSNIVIESSFTDAVETLDWNSDEHDSHILLFTALVTAEHWYHLPDKNPMEHFLQGIHTAKEMLQAYDQNITVPVYTLIPFYDPEFNIPSYTHFNLSRSGEAVSSPHYE
ncbi:MAG: hypothetical protein ACTTJ7_00600 [Treponema sp.]